MEETTKKLRMNISISEKGIAQWDITAEYETPKEPAKNLREAIDEIHRSHFCCIVREIVNA
jgi:hypothetical protein